MRWKACGALLLALSLPGAPALTQQNAPPKGAKPSAVMIGYQALQQDYRKALEKYYEPITKAKTDEERAKVRLDESKNPAIAFLPKYQALAKRAQGTDVGAQCLLWIIQNGQSARQPQAAKDAVASLMKAYINSPAMAQAAAFIRYYGDSLGPNRSTELLNQIAEKSTNREVKAAALYNLGAKMMERSQSPEDKEKATALFSRISREFAGTRWAKEADSSLFEIANLQIGKTAPDFEATDQENKPFKLSDYRGKVVVIDFWGFW